MKRSSSVISESDSHPAFSPPPDTTPSTPPPTKKSKVSTTPKTPRRTPAKSKKLEPASPKGKLLAYLLAEGFNKIDRAEAERLTGLKPAQQRELMREDGKGALYNALFKLAEEM